MRLKNVFLIILGILIVWFLYLERAILTPFIVAAIFAYVLNPLVSFCTNKLKITRPFAVSIIYLLILLLVSSGLIFITRQVISEWSDLTHFATHVITQTQRQVYSLPTWLQLSIADSLKSIEKSNFFSGRELVILFPKAFTRIISFLIFLFSSFYFLKEGHKIFDTILNFSPKKYRIEVEILLRKINTVLGDYLRGQLFLIALVATILFIALSILGIKYALIIAIFSGFAEIVPLVGPIIACTIAVLVSLFTGAASFGLQPYQIAIVIVIIYFVLRHLEDYLVIPFIMGKVTKLHPLVILFAVLSGEHLMGILGLIIAVPTAAVVKILLEYSLDKVNEQEHSALKK